MPRRAWISWLSALTLTALAGCADNPMVLQGRLAEYRRQQDTLTAQNRQLQDRAANMERDNQDLVAQLAQARQQTRVSEDQLAAVREQLRSATSQLTQAQTEGQQSEQKAQALSASLHRQGGVSISPNNSYLQTLPVINQPDVYVRRDGDVIRIELPGNRLFDSGGAQLRPGAANLIADAAAELRRNYPDQIIGIEGHTDSDPILGGQYRNNHELSMARAMAVYNLLIAGTQLRAEQLFVVGHGSNHPVVSNGYAAGKQRNRRVELVVYPEKRG
jgi:flagellar motor protein MotB